MSAEPGSGGLEEGAAGFMRRALELAEQGLFTTDPNPRVGCVIVREGRIVGEGWHRRAGEPHAEVLALRAAGGAAHGATAYVTLEPCCHTGRTGPCAEALIGAGIARVVAAAVDPNPKVAGGGLRRLRAAGIEVSTGLMAPQARALNPGFYSRFERGRPYIRLKLAMSLDGRTAPAGGGPLWISGEESRADVQRWRARSSAILTGAGTVRSDDPRLDVRLEYGAFVRQPLRVLLDADLSCRADAKIFRGGGALVFAAPDAPHRPGSLAHADAPPTADPPGTPSGARLERVPRAADGRGLDLAAVLAKLEEVAEINEILVECGPRLAGSFVLAGLVDELVLYIAPSLLGADAAPLLAMTGFAPGALPGFEFREVRRIGADLRVVSVPAGHPTGAASAAQPPSSLHET